MGEQGKGILRLNRTAQYVNKARGFRIHVDGQHVRDVRDGCSVDIELDVGEYEVDVRVDWWKSETVKVKIEEGKVSSLQCGSPLRGLKMFLVYVYLFRTEGALFLKEEGK